MTTGVFKYMSESAQHSLYRNGLVYMQRDAVGDDSTWVGTDLVDYQIEVGDARALADGESKVLARHGFELMHQPVDHLQIDFFDNHSLLSAYYPDCERIIQEVTGARLVRAFDHNVRSAQGKESQRKIVNGQNIQGPVHVVHGDYTLTSAPDRLRQLCSPPKTNDTYASRLSAGESLLDDPVVLEAMREGRFAIINVWRNIVDDPVEVNPLALCDASTVDPEDLVVFEIRYADRIGENYFAKYSQRHKWWYFPRMTKDEALLIKQWDSEGGVAVSKGSFSDSDISTFSFHTAFEDPNTADDAPDRWSIEVRCAVLY